METLVQGNAIAAELKALGIQSHNSGVSTGVNWLTGAGNGIESFSPVDGALIAGCISASREEYEVIMQTAEKAFREWRMWPAPKRGEVVRQLGDKLREHKQDLGKLVSYEMGKSLQEGLGEVQEMIDICDFAVGLSRQLYGLTIASERPGHRMMETWQPMGPCAVISAFNFPVAVWAWNATLALVCGDPVIWKPSEKTPLTALASMKIFERALARFGGDAPPGLAQCVIGGADLGDALAASRDVPIVSATGSTRMGALVGPKVSARFGRSILELGGNNALIVDASADLRLAIPSIVFAAIGTAGQRCTTLRRLFVHDSVYDAFVSRLKAAYASVPVGDPRAGGVLVGPLVDKAAFDAMQDALEQARASECATAELFADRVDGCIELLVGVLAGV